MAKKKRTALPEKEEFKDLGFGTHIGANTQRLILPDGRLNVERRENSWGAIHPYLFLVTIPWWQFLLVVVAAYLLFNGCFAMLYLMAGVEQLAGAPRSQALLDEFAHAFYFSVQTFTTVGYGSISPSGDAANLIASFEAMAGLMGFALASGVFYGRFSKPSAKIRFSKQAVIAPYRGINSFEFRIVNRRSNQLIELEAQLVLMWYEMEGEQARQRFFRLELERDRITLFPMNWTLVHPITENSPLYGLKAGELLNRNAEFMVMIKAYDDTFAQHVHARYSYKARDLRWGARFEMMFYTDQRGKTIVELDHIDHTYPAPLNPPLGEES
ncbi:MAG: hypothetical protein D6730_12380 [Bacteroidetes bacterium]|nr:MAG: hypothetical protein D6730_12380 [Bacteroidota bacterium]